LLTLASLYRGRADAENILDELKNHWGWGGFTTQDLARTRSMARITALVYDWWSLFVRLIDPTCWPLRHRCEFCVSASARGRNEPFHVSGHAP
jgi:hypothetical protein